MALGCSSSSGNGGNGGGGGAGTACTSGPTSSHACLGPGRDNCNPCTKITDAQANAAAGVTLTPGAQNADTCNWYVNDANGNPTLIVSFLVGIDPGTFACDPANGFQFMTVSGVGDSACYTQEPVGPNVSWILEFEKGCAVYDAEVTTGYSVTPLPAAQQQSEEKALALAAVPNL